jgi:hypothetical protein
MNQSDGLRIGTKRAAGCDSHQGVSLTPGATTVRHTELVGLNPDPFQGQERGRLQASALHIALNKRWYARHLSGRSVGSEFARRSGR